jgi:hypothetical protein
MPLKHGHLRNKSKKSYWILKGKLSEGSMGLLLTQTVLRRTNEEINNLLKQRSIVRYIKLSLAWLGHLERMHEERTTEKTTRWKPLSSRPKGRPKTKWENVLRHLQIMKIKSWKMFVSWKENADLAKIHSGLLSYDRNSCD